MSQDDASLDDAAEPTSPPPPSPAAPVSDSGLDGDQEYYVPVQVSSDTAEDHPDHDSDGGVHVDESERNIGDKFESFIKNKRQVRIELAIDRVDLLPPQLRQPITNIITKIRRWALRNPSGPALSGLQDLADRLNEFLELQTRRNDHDYEVRCRDLLRAIYQDTLETQRVTRELKDAAIPRGLDEYG
jgi:hypothetical protein